MSMKTDDNSDEQESPQDVQVTLTFTNSYSDTDPMSNPLAGLPALPKTHHSWPIYSLTESYNNYATLGPTLSVSGHNILSRNEYRTYNVRG